MDSHHEKKINQLLGEFRATEEGNVWAETGQSSQGSHDESNQVHQDNKINQHGGKLSKTIYLVIMIILSLLH